MKSQKRSHSDRAFSKGYQAAITGRSWSSCPFEGNKAKQLWMSGWREGRQDQWSGFNSFAQAQRLSNI